jgi:hypothetical protein
VDRRDFGDLDEKHPWLEALETLDADMIRQCQTIVLFLFVEPVLCFAASANSSHNLTLREATPAQAAATLGKPTKDELTDLGRSDPVLSRLVEPEHKHDAVRILKFYGLESFRAVFLAFLMDKLYLTVLYPDKGNVFKPDDLGATYPSCEFSAPIPGYLDLSSVVGHCPGEQTGILAGITKANRVLYLMLFDEAVFPPNHAKAQKSLQ